jgi:hypothetical protein
VNARMVSKSSFRHFSMENEDRNQFLRPDRIMAAFQYIPQDQLPSKQAGIGTDIQQEAQKDKLLVKYLEESDAKARENICRIEQVTIDIDPEESEKRTSDKTGRVK